MSHEAKKTHIIICCLIDCLGELVSYYCVRNYLGKEAENTIRGIYKQHKEEYLKRKKK